jgi:hypothetical protein
LLGDFGIGRHERSVLDPVSSWPGLSRPSMS